MLPNTKHLKNMLDLQSSFNEKINQDWKNAGYQFVDAIWTEAAEAFNHTNWEWWKKTGTATDMGQIKMEIVDIWHFIMSELMNHEEVEGVTHLGLVVDICEALKGQLVKNPELDIGLIKMALKEMIGSALMPSRENRIVFIISNFVRLLSAANMSWDELYKLYLGKNTLNIFRQNNGYKTATEMYKLMWAKEKGWEDNQYLTELLEQLAFGAGDVVDHQAIIMQELYAIYNKDED
jgi:dimeric dUTPase (all-alpha-NTP-PPase superfamily)